MHIPPICDASAPTAVDLRTVQYGPRPVSYPNIRKGDLFGNGTGVLVVESPESEVTSPVIMAGFVRSVTSPENTSLVLNPEPRAPNPEL